MSNVCVVPRLFDGTLHITCGSLETMLSFSTSRAFRRRSFLTTLAGLITDPDRYEPQASASWLANTGGQHSTQETSASTMEDYDPAEVTREPHPSPGDHRTPFLVGALAPARQDEHLDVQIEQKIVARLGLNEAFKDRTLEWCGRAAYHCRRAGGHSRTLQREGGSQHGVASWAFIESLRTGRHRDRKAPGPLVEDQLARGPGEHGDGRPPLGVAEQPHRSLLWSQRDGGSESTWLIDEVCDAFAAVRHELAFISQERDSRF
jgi:hypothetical protein